MAAKNRRYYAANAAKWPEYAKAWIAAYPEKKARLRYARKARELAAPGEATAAQIRARLDFYGGLCWVCGAEATTIDHVIPLAKGGSNWPANLRPACRSCNARKGARAWQEAV